MSSKSILPHCPKWSLFFGDIFLKEILPPALPAPPHPFWGAAFSNKKIGAAFWCGFWKTIF